MDRLKSNSETGSPEVKSGNKLKFDFNSVDLASQEIERAKSNERQLKVIEDQMIQSKQVERAFKRQDGDVKKEQRQIRQTVREFDACKNQYLILCLLPWNQTQLFFFINSGALNPKKILIHV